MMTTVINEGMEIADKIGSHPLFRAVFALIAIGGTVYYVNKKLSYKISKEELDAIVNRLDAEFQNMEKKHKFVMDRIEQLEKCGKGASQEELTELRNELADIKNQQKNHTETLEKRINSEALLAESVNNLKQQQKDSEKTFQEIDTKIKSLFDEIKILTPSNKKPIAMGHSVK